MNVLVLLAAIIFLLALNGLFVAAEFAAISVKKQRLAQIAESGNPCGTAHVGDCRRPTQARYLCLHLPAWHHSDQSGARFLWAGADDRADHALFQRFTANAETLASTVSTIVVLLVLTILQVILSELVPKHISIRHAEQMALITARPLLLLQTLFYPLILLLNSSGALILRLLGRRKWLPSTDMSIRPKRW